MGGIVINKGPAQQWWTVVYRVTVGPSFTTSSRVLTQTVYAAVADWQVTLCHRWVETARAGTRGRATGRRLLQSPRFLYQRHQTTRSPQ